MKKELKIVIDTNIWISYFINSNFTDLTELIHNNNIILYIDDVLLNEIKDILARKKFAKYHFDVGKILEFIISITTTVKTQPLFKDCPDPKDNFLYDLALQTNADYLVTGDRKLLTFFVDSFQTISLTTFKVMFLDN